MQTAYGSDTLRILVADDEELERLALRRILSQMNGIQFDILEASNGLQALELARNSPPDLVLLDIRMPGLDGIAAARELRQLVPSVRIVFITAFDSFDYAREALRMGVDEYLVKPAEPDDVRALVSSTLSRLATVRAAQSQTTKDREDKERALTLLEKELRTGMQKGALDIERWDAFMRLRGFSAEQRFGICVRILFPDSEESHLRDACTRRLCGAAENWFSREACFSLSAAKEPCVYVAASRSIGTGESIDALLESFQVYVHRELALKILCGVIVCEPDCSGNVFTGALKALAMARPDQPLVILDKSLGPEPNDACIASCGDRIVSRALRMIKSQLAQNLSLSDVAEAVGCSSYHLSRLFSQHLGQTFVQTFTSLRLSSAKELLKSGRYSVKEVGALSGFRDQAYFARVFRKEEGCSPAEFRSKTALEE